MTTRAEILDVSKATDRLKRLVEEMGRWKESMVSSQDRLSGLLNKTENKSAAKCELVLHFSHLPPSEAILSITTNPENSEERLCVEKIQTIISEILANRIAKSMKRVSELAAEIAS